MATAVRTYWTFKGLEYHFTYPVTRHWARWYLRTREGVNGI
jgi:hypothetical protein